MELRASFILPPEAPSTQHSTTRDRRLEVMAQVIYSGLGDGNADLSGELFEGLKFFVSQRCPLRTTYLDKIISNGGRVVKFEQQADYLIADHFKRNLNPAGALSYTVIDDAIRAGQLPDFNEAKYIAGPETGSFRAVGSSRPIKVGRTPFTLEDKVQLYDWVQSVARRGGSTRGNEIYKQLESIVGSFILPLLLHLLTGARIHDTLTKRGETTGSSN